MTPPKIAYAAAVLVIYLVLLLPATYTAWKHGVRGLAWIGWGYFLLFCLLRIVGSALQIADPESTDAAIISSVGLSPLAIAAAGILHEGRSYLFVGDKDHCSNQTNKIETILILVFHVLVATAIALLASGASSLISAGPTADSSSSSSSTINTGWHVAGGGALLLFLTLVVLFIAAMYTDHASRNSLSGQRKVLLARRLVLAVLIATPLLGIRVLGTAVYFLGQREDMSPVSGGWGCRIGLYLVPEVLAAMGLLGGGVGASGLRG